MQIFYKRKAPKIIHFESTLPFLIPYIEEQADQLKEEIGANIQEPTFKNQRLWIYGRKFRFVIYTETGMIIGEAKIGGGTDLNSIPSILETMEKRDDRDGLFAGLCHDIFFCLQYPFFDFANCFFYQLNDFFGMGRFKTWRRWFAVQNGGFEAWEKSSNPVKLEIEREFFSIKEIPYNSESEKEIYRLRGIEFKKRQKAAKNGKR